MTILKVSHLHHLSSTETSCLKQVKSNISFIFSPPTFLTAVQTFEDSSCKKCNKLLGGGNTLLH